MKFPFFFLSWKIDHPHTTAYPIFCPYPVTRKFERLEFWIILTLKWIIKKDKTEDTNIFTTCKVLLCNSKEWGICVSKKDGGFEGMHRAHGRFERPGKDIEITAKTIWTRRTAITRYKIFVIVRTKKPSNVKI